VQIGNKLTVFALREKPPSMAVWKKKGKVQSYKTRKMKIKSEKDKKSKAKKQK
jgi:hypothetical protein